VQLASIGVANEEPNRQALREMLFTAEGVENHISGVVSVFAVYSSPPPLVSPSFLLPQSSQTPGSPAHSLHPPPSFIVCTSHEHHWKAMGGEGRVGSSGKMCIQ